MRSIPKASKHITVSVNVQCTLCICSILAQGFIPTSACKHKGLDPYMYMYRLPSSVFKQAYKLSNQHLHTGVYMYTVQYV